MVMKKRFLTFMAAAFLFSITAILASCGGDAKDGEGDEDVVEVADTTKKVEDKVDTTKTADTTATLDLTKGKELFTAKGCVACHKADGTGDDAFKSPSFVGAEIFKDKAATLKILINGSEKIKTMVAYGSLKDEEIAALASYVGNSFENTLGAVTAEDVAAARK